MNEHRARIFVNGELIGTHDHPSGLVEEFRQKRRHSEISDQVNVTYHERTNEVFINTCIGRARRPLIVVKNGKPLITEEHIEMLKAGDLTFEDLIKEGAVEYIDAGEEENTYIAIDESDLNERHTHLEVDPSLILGISTGMLPYPE
ncbi:MAG: DNA-directed RNA polymerase subunit B, partial [Halobacteriota archaeon]|nr:DNA-directed RNA polymerase subunit B [Halobacteriota archaeon]